MGLLVVNIPIVTLDKIYIEPDENNIFFLDCTRVNGTNEIISRKSESLDSQIRRIASVLPKKEIILADDVVFSGSVLKNIIGRFQSLGIKVLGVISSISSYEGYEYFSKNLKYGIRTNFVMSDDVVDQICESVVIMTMDGRLVEKTAEQMAFSYRHSCLEDAPGIIVSAVFQLHKKPESEIRSQMQELMRKRSASQPLDMPSAGSAFKRPVGGYAAALIDETGLKGFRVGGAAVSEKHAGFAVNLGGATADDVKELLRQVTQKVYEKTGTRLEPEVRIW